jgi:hypothetical protein
MRRAYPLWLQRGESFARISGLIAMLWAVVFAVLALASIRSSGLHAMSPAYIAMVGLLVGPLCCACPTWLIHRAGLSRTSAEFFILGLPFMLKRDVDPELSLSVHFVVSGAEPGSYYVEISKGRCSAGQGDLKHPGLTIYCSTDSWNLVARGTLSPGHAVARGLLRIVGSAEVYTRFFQCFELATRGTASRAVAGPRRIDDRSGSASAFEREKRIENKSPADGRIWASPVPSGGRECANMRTIFYFFTENAKIADWVADDAVWCELLSASNSLIIRENTGNFIDFGLIRGSRNWETAVKIYAFSWNSLNFWTGN